MLAMTASAYRGGNIVYFADLDHKRSYSQLSKMLTTDDKRLVAAVYALSAMGKDERIGQYIHGHWIDLEGLLEEGIKWSSGEKALLALAANIYDSDCSANVHDVFSSLDDTNTKIALETLKIRYLRDGFE
jgi:hypothetical protein